MVAGKAVQLNKSHSVRPTVPLIQPAVASLANKQIDTEVLLTRQPDVKLDVSLSPSVAAEQALIELGKDAEKASKELAKTVSEPKKETQLSNFDERCKKTKQSLLSQSAIGLSFGLALGKAGLGGVSVSGTARLAGKQVSEKPLTFYNNVLSFGSFFWWGKSYCEGTLRTNKGFGFPVPYSKTGSLGVFYSYHPVLKSWRFAVNIPNVFEVAVMNNIIGIDVAIPSVVPGVFGDLGCFVQHPWLGVVTRPILSAMGYVMENAVTPVVDAVRPYVLAAKEKIKRSWENVVDGASRAQDALSERTLAPVSAPPRDK